MRPVSCVFKTNCFSEAHSLACLKFYRPDPLECRILLLGIKGCRVKCIALSVIKEQEHFYLPWPV